MNQLLANHLTQASSNPGPNWTSFTVPLVAGAGWRVGSLNGPAAAAAELQTVLASLTALRLRGEYSPTPLEEIAALDNVQLAGTATTAGPVAHWRFDESSGTIAHDSIGAYHGTLSASGAGFVTNGIRGNSLASVVVTTVWPFTWTVRRLKPAEREVPLLPMPPTS